MNYSRLLSLATAFLVLLGTFLQGMGKANLTLWWLMPPVVLVTVYFNDLKGWFRLNRNVANWAALAAALYSFTRFFQAPDSTRLYPISDLLVYLEIILLFQEKTHRVYGQLIMLSMLQVVVAAALDVNVWCGLLIFVYLLIALVAVVILFMESERGRFTMSALSPSLPQTDRTVRLFSNRIPGEMQSDRLWGILPAVAPLLGFTLSVMLAVFYLAPRRETLGAGGLNPGKSVVGFSEDVHLGELDSVAEDPEIVMTVQFIDPTKQESFHALRSPLLRGSVVTVYKPLENQWYRSRWKPGSAAGLSTRLLLDTQQTMAVEQKITLEPLQQSVAFSVYPPVSIDEHVGFDSDRQRLYRTSRRRTTYSISTLGFDGRRQAAVVPQTEVLTGALDAIGRNLAEQLAPRLQDYLNECKEVPLLPSGESPFPGLTELARQVVDDAAVPLLADAQEDQPRYDPLLAVRALERYLRTDGGFTYALEPRRIPRGIDPIEDFVVNNRRGHCEYFASALVMMLRSLDIPARMVIGFRAEEWNSLGQFYVVRQLHAHTWVEAFLRPEDLRRHNLKLAQLPFGTADGEEDSITMGGWLLLDPTAAATGATNRYATGLFGAFREFADYLQSGWTSWVLGMDADLQRRIVFDPLKHAIQFPREFFSGDAGILAGFRKVVQAIGSFLTNWTGGRWFSWRGGLAAAAICLIFLAVLTLLRGTWRWAWRFALGRRRDGRAAGGSRVAFHERFLRLLARRGFARGAGQTSLELATAVGESLARSPEGREVATAPRRIVEAFYQVRFGGRPLDNQQLATVEKALDDLEAALGRRPGEGST